MKPYIIAITLLCGLPTIVAVFELTNSPDATNLRSWAELIRWVATAWLTLLTPAVLLRWLLSTLPSLLAERASRRKTEQEIKILQRRAHLLLLPGQSPSPLIPDHLLEENDSNTPADNASSNAPCTEENDSGDDDTPEDKADPQTVSPIHIYLHGGVCSTWRWRLLSSLLIAPISVLLLISIREMIDLIFSDSDEYFISFFLSTLATSLYYTVFPALAYWGLFELLHRFIPKLFTNLTGHCLIGALAGFLITALTIHIDLDAQERDRAMIFWLSTGGVLLGAALPFFYRLPVYMPGFFTDNTPPY